MNKNLAKILKFRKDRDWEQFHLPKNMAISLVLEATEVLELFQWTKDNMLPEGKKEDLKDELADIYYWLLLISHDMKIDIEKALTEKMIKNEQKYLVKKAKGNSKKYTELK